jgi:hypothetical protein
LVPAEAPQADSSPAADPKPEPEADQAPPPTKKASKILSAVIEVVAAENPHRAKTFAAQRFAMFKSGQTVEEHLHVRGPYDGRTGPCAGV